MRGMTRTALVVGGTSGIGAATARRLAADGLHVIAAGLNAHTPEASAPHPVQVELDLRQPGDLEGLISSLGALDVLVNAAASSGVATSTSRTCFARSWRST